ncbi:putative 2'-deoxynucleoside 5'-phosphate N-hydrolase 1 [Babylonia areolata]|uniref:putative 2'-deoxynucleoside 5'-phosphate N-hydrolase 1 n=1 Tax=Babylonia areolata TaxID=304850 RepID=UPI003FD2C563
MAVNIYFAGSIGGGREDADIYLCIVEQLKKYGHVLTEHVAYPNPQSIEIGMTDKEIHDGDINWLEQSDVVVAECTQTSHGVGYEIGRAVGLGKKILVLFRPDTGKKLSSMIRGAENGTSFICKDYKMEEMPDILKTYFENFKL